MHRITSIRWGKFCRLFFRFVVCLFAFCVLCANKKVISSNGQNVNIKCHHDDQSFRNTCYAAVRLLLDGDHQQRPLSDFIALFNDKFNKTLNERTIKAMKHAIEVSCILKWMNFNRVLQALPLTHLFIRIFHTDSSCKWYQIRCRHKTNSFRSWIDWSHWNAWCCEIARFVQFT